MSKLIKFAAGTVFSLSIFCVLSSFSFAAGSGPAVVSASGLNLRSGPGMEYRVTSSLSKGQRIEILDESYDWYKIRTPLGYTAWASRDYFSKETGSLSSRGERTSYLPGDIKTKILNYSKKFLGVQYVWGGSSPNGFDCSGFVKYVFDNFGITLNRVAKDQATQGTYIGKGELRPCDLVFFDTDGGGEINHVGIYIGDGRFIQASSGRSKVIISDITTGFYAKAFRLAKRIL